MLFKIIRYNIALNLGHIHPFLPLISDIGVLPPEASICSLFMNFGSLQLIFFAIIRSQAIKVFIENNKIISQDVIQKQRNLIRLSLVSGLGMATGQAITGNFPNSDEPFVQTLHTIGAYIVFVSSLFEIYFGSKLAFCQSLDITARFRFIQFELHLMIALVFCIFHYSSFYAYPLAYFNISARLMWNSSNDGYYFHIIATVSEWFLIINLSVYYFSYVSQFRQFSLSRQIVVIKGFN